MARGHLLYTGPVAEMGAPARVRLRTTDDPQAAALLTAAGWQIATPNAAGTETAPAAVGEGTKIAPNAAGLEVAVTPGQEWQITRHLAQAGVYVSEMRPVSGALEAGFMEVIAATASDD